MWFWFEITFACDLSQHCWFSTSCFCPEVFASSSTLDNDRITVQYAALIRRQDVNGWRRRRRAFTPVDYLIYLYLPVITLVESSVTNKSQRINTSMHKHWQRHRVTERDLNVSYLVSVATYHSSVSPNKIARVFRLKTTTMSSAIIVFLLSGRRRLPASQSGSVIKASLKGNWRHILT